MDPMILTLEELNRVRPFVALEEQTTLTAAIQTSKGGSAVPPIIEEMAEEEEVGLQRMRSKQPAGGAPLNIVPLRIAACTTSGSPRTQSRTTLASLSLELPYLL